MPTETFFQTVSSSDPLRFGRGGHFHPEKVRDFLNLKNDDVSRLGWRSGVGRLGL